MEYRLEDSLGFAIHRVDMRLKVIAAQHLRPHGLTPEQFAVLATLCSHTGMSQRELADHLVKDRPNITRILDKLQSKGLVERHPDPHDRRVYRVHATPAGRDLRDHLAPMVLDVRRRLFSALSAAEQTAMRRLLDHLFTSLE